VYKIDSLELCKVVVSSRNVKTKNHDQPGFTGLRFT